MLASIFIKKSSQNCVFNVFIRAKQELFKKVKYGFKNSLYCPLKTIHYLPFLRCISSYQLDGKVSPLRPPPPPLGCKIRSNLISRQLQLDFLQFPKINLDRICTLGSWTLKKIIMKTYYSILHLSKALSTVFTLLITKCLKGTVSQQFRIPF